jgi:hypothetical protein
VHCVRNEGFADKLVTTSFFDENIDDIFAKLHPEDNAETVSSHNVFGMLGLMYADRTASGAPASLTSFRPFVPGACGDWRGMGGVTRSVNLVAGEVSKQVQVVSSGDSFSFSCKSEGAESVNSAVKSISKKAPSANATSDENVFEICAEIDGHRQNATVTLYRASDGSRVVDGKSLFFRIIEQIRSTTLLIYPFTCYALFYFYSTKPLFFYLRCLGHIVNVTSCLLSLLVCCHIMSVVTSCLLSLLAVWIDGQTGDNLTHSQFTVPVVSYSSGASVSGHPVIKSPMPGKVIKLYCAEGDRVKAGDSVVVIEAMKMEHVITAPCDG